MPFSVEAEVPVTWECRVCGAQALRVGGTVEEDKPSKPARTHWDMLLERRSLPELEEVLAERLALLRGGGFGSGPRSARPPMNLATGAPEPGAAANGAAGSGATGGAKASAAAAKKTTAKKTVAKKTTAGTAPAKKTAASKAAPATKAADKPAKKPAAKKPSAK
jgi:hypothetical protein